MRRLLWVLWGAALALGAGDGVSNLRLTTDWEPYHIGNRSTVRVELSAPAPAEALQLEWTLTDIAGQPVDDGRAALVAGQPVAAAWNVTLPQLGYYDLAVRLVDERGVCFDQTATTFARVELQPTVFDSDGYFGVNGHNEPGAATILRQVGATMWRADILWAKVEPRPGEWDFSYYDELVNTLYDNGIELLANLDYNPDWLTPAPGQGTDPAKYHEYVRQVVTRYRDRISHWDLWNEPQYSWSGDKNDFAAMQLATCRLIQELQPEAEVVFNGHPFEEELRGYTLEQLQSLNGQVPMTALGVHPYNRPLGPDDNDFLRHMTNIRRWLDGYAPEVKLWISELGWPTSTDALGVTERAQASFLTRAAVYGLAAGCEKFIYYQPFSGTDPVYHEARYGLLNHLRQPKPALAVFANLARTLRPLRFERMLELGGAARGALFSDGGTGGVIVLWATHDPVKLSLPAPESPASLSRVDGSLPAPTSESGVLLLDDLPLLVNAPTVNPWVRAIEGGHLTLERPVVLTAATVVGDGLYLRVANRDKNAVEVKAAVTLPDGVRFRHPSRRDAATVELQFRIDHAEKELRLQLDAPPELTDAVVAMELSCGADSRPLTVPWQVYGGHFRPDYPVDGDVAKWDGYPAHAFDGLGDIAPADLQKDWRGVADLSVAQAWFGWNERGVILTVQARDDRHDAAKLPVRMWGADSLQIGVNTTTGIAPDYYDEYSAEIGVGLLADGGTATYQYAGSGDAAIEAAVRREEETGLTTYDVLIPWSVVGRAGAPAAGEVIGLNFIVNDTDGGGPRKWVQAGPGIGEKKSPARFPRLRLLPR